MPIEIKNGLTEKHLDRFHKQFVNFGREELELLWVRTQQDGQGQKRRMIHGLDTYAVVATTNGYSLVNIDPYVWYQMAVPAKEIKKYERKIQTNLNRSQWQKRETGTYQLDDLILRYQIKNREIKDTAAGRSWPTDYHLVELEIRSSQNKPGEKEQNRWDTLARGIRSKETRGNPQIAENPKEIEKYFPMQVELGCGPSIEAGIPPLYYFHTLYSVQEPIKGTPILELNKDHFLNQIIEKPKKFFRRSGRIYATALTAPLTEFHYLLKELYDRQIIVGEIITESFDGLCNLVDLKERYVRTFDNHQYFPKINFHPQARSLLVVGSHADRRKVQEQARAKGLKIIFVDSEGFIGKNGIFTAYPLESAQDNDILFPMTAREFAARWKSPKIYNSPLRGW